MTPPNFLSSRRGQLPLAPGVRTAHDVATQVLASKGLVASTLVPGILYVHAGAAGNRLDVGPAGGIVRWSPGSSEPWIACRAGALTDPQAFAQLCSWILDKGFDGLPNELEVNGRYLELMGASITWLDEGAVLAVQRPERTERWLFVHSDGAMRFQDDPSGVVLEMEVDLGDLAHLAECYQQLDQMFEELCSPVTALEPE